VPPLQELFESNAVVKILDFLTLFKDFEYTRTDIANETGISRRTLYQAFPVLEKFGLVTVSKSIGNIKLYKLNTESSICKSLVFLADEIALYNAEKSTGIELTRKEEFASSCTAEITKIKFTGTASSVQKATQTVLNENSSASIPITDSTESKDGSKIKKNFYVDFM
jgi:hypothetical protein